MIRALQIGQNMGSISRPQRTYGLDENRIEIHAPHPVEDRGIIIGKHHNKLWTVIYTMRGDVIRIISLRRARKKEAKLYEKENPG